MFTHCVECHRHVISNDPRPRCEPCLAFLRALGIVK